MESNTIGSKKVLVVGELNVDIILNNIDGFPIIGREILADNLTLTLGSSSAIFASNISTLGGDTSFCGMVGNDSFGEFILEELKRKKVNTTYITQVNNCRTGVTIVLNYEQDRANITHCGAMEVFNNSYIPFEKIGQFNHLHFSSYFLQKGIRSEVTSLFREAKANGLTTSLDLQWDPENKWQFPYESCLPFVDVFLPNEAEILMLSGENQLNRALEKIGRFANLIIVKQGAKGALAYYEGKVIASQPFLHDRFVDAIGAGDSFNAGFIIKYLNGCSLEESLQFASLAGAVNTTASGGTAALDSIDSFKRRSKEIFNIVL